MTDKVDEAIAATEQTIDMMEIPVRLTTGRPSFIHVPADCTEAELFELVGFMGTQVRVHVRALAEQRSPIVIAKALPQ